MGDLWFAWTLAVDLLNLRIKMSSFELLPYFRGVFAILKLRERAHSSLFHKSPSFHDLFDRQHEALKRRFVCGHLSTLDETYIKLRLADLGPDFALGDVLVLSAFYKFS